MHKLLTRKTVFVLLVCLSAVPGVTAPFALLAGLVFALFAGGTYSAFSKRASKILLQAAVVGVGFGMNLHSAFESGWKGMAFTVLSVVFVMFAGWLIGRLMGVERKVSYLISSGTAICGGSAIAAVSPIVKADDSQMSVSLGTIFALNALALLVFPPVGHLLGLSEVQFGEWAAIAIHDTSSVVGAGAAYGDQALQTATLIKCTRALWIMPLAFVTTLIVREKGAKVTVPWFIVLFVAAMVVNTFMPASALWAQCSKTVVFLSKQAMCVTLFLIGSALSPATLRRVGWRPLLQGVVLWVVTAIVSLTAVLQAT